jgi:hypothetical protein
MACQSRSVKANLIRQIFLKRPCGDAAKALRYSLRQPCLISTQIYPQLRAIPGFVQRAGMKGLSAKNNESLASLKHFAPGKKLTAYLTA